MNPFEKIYEENLHHAYLVVGNLDMARRQVLDFLRRIGMTVVGNPDLRHEKYDTFTKNLAGDLVLAAAQKSFGEKTGRKIFIIETNIMTEEAQNALLKIFEEPTIGTHFFILMPQDILLPTLRSRMQIVNLENHQSEKSENIMKRPIVDRLTMIKEITDGIVDEEKTKQDAIALLNKIESELYARGVENESKKLKLCQTTRAALYDRGAPIKMILENLVINI
jgi:DNA polymerase III delta prime subunit